MKLKLTALLLVLYTGLYAQNKIVLTAPRLDTSSLSNRINLKANTNLNNVNGVLSSTYGGAGSVSGILKADGSGVVSPVIASDITTLISGTYLPLSGGTLTGALNGTSAAFSGAGSFGGSMEIKGTSSNSIGVGSLYQLSDNTNILSSVLQLNASGGIDLWSLVSGSWQKNISVSNTGALSGTSAAFSGAGSFGSTITGNGNAIFQLSSSSVLNIGADQLMYGGSNSDGGVFVYGANKLHLSTNSSRRLTITDDGKVGIGTVSPAANFVVASGRTLLNTTTESPNNEALQVAGSGLFTSRITSTGYYGADNANLIAEAVNTNGTVLTLNSQGTVGTIKLQTANTDRLTIASTGAITASSSVTASSIIKSGGTSAQFLKADGSVDGSTYITSASVGNGTLTLNVSGSGLSGSQSFTANQSGNATFTVTSNATTAATASTIAYRDGSGNLTAAGFFESSSIKLKDIFSQRKQDDGIDFIGFKWKKELNLDNKKHLGVIAEQVEKVIPDAVNLNSDGVKSVNYTEVLIFKLEKLTEKVSELEKELKKLKTKN